MSSGLLLASVTDGLWKLTHEGDKGGGEADRLLGFFCPCAALAVIMRCMG